MQEYDTGEGKEKNSKNSSTKGSCRLEFISGQPVLRLAGSISGEIKEDLEQAYAAAEADALKTGAIVCDFSGVDFLNSAALALLIGMINHASASGLRIVFTALTSHLYRVIEMLDLLESIEIADSVEAFLE